MLPAGLLFSLAKRLIGMGRLQFILSLLRKLIFLILLGYFANKVYRDVTVLRKLQRIFTCSKAVELREPEFFFRFFQALTQGFNTKSLRTRW